MDYAEKRLNNAHNVLGYCQLSQFCIEFRETKSGVLWWPRGVTSVPFQNRISILEWKFPLQSGTSTLEWNRRILEWKFHLLRMRIMLKSPRGVLTASLAAMQRSSSRPPNRSPTPPNGSPRPPREARTRREAGRSVQLYTISCSS